MSTASVSMDLTDPGDAERLTVEKLYQTTPIVDDPDILHVHCGPRCSILMSPQVAAVLAEKLNAHFAQLAKAEGLTQARAISETLT